MISYISIRIASTVITGLFIFAAVVAFSINLTRTVFNGTPVESCIAAIVLAFGLASCFLSACFLKEQDDNDLL